MKLLIWLVAVFAALIAAEEYLIGTQTMIASLIDTSISSTLVNSSTGLVSYDTPSATASSTAPACTCVCTGKLCVLNDCAQQDFNGSIASGLVPRAIQLCESALPSYAPCLSTSNYPTTTLGYLASYKYEVNQEITATDSTSATPTSVELIMETLSPAVPTTVGVPKPYGSNVSSVPTEIIVAANSQVVSAEAFNGTAFLFMMTTPTGAPSDFPTLSSTPTIAAVTTSYVETTPLSDIGTKTAISSSTSTAGAYGFKFDSVVSRNVLALAGLLALVQGEDI
ncbi:MAG: hypothetical protein M1819_002929 [Sarea resinae]|nr:MAG: hypothetical protein M1819_002929 [Sarea resinae]